MNETQTLPFMMKADANGNPFLWCSEARVTGINEPIRGTSKKTGNPYVIINFFVQIELPGCARSMRLFVKAFGYEADKFTTLQDPIKVGDKASMFLDFNVSNGRYAQTEVECKDIVRI